MLNSPFDEKTFSDLRTTFGDDFIPELVATYLEETPLLINELQEALASADIQAFTRAAHSIKSSSKSMGAFVFAENARELEMIGKSGDLSQAAIKLTELTGTYPELEQALKEYL